MLYNRFKQFKTTIFQNYFSCPVTLSDLKKKKIWCNLQILLFCCVVKKLFFYACDILSVWYILYAKGHQRDSNNQQIQKVKVVPAERSFVQKRAVGRHLNENGKTAKQTYKTTYVSHQQEMHPTAPLSTISYNHHLNYQRLCDRSVRASVVLFQENYSL